MEALIEVLVLFVLPLKSVIVNDVCHHLGEPGEDNQLSIHRKAKIGQIKTLTAALYNSGHISVHEDRVTISG